MSCSVHVSGPGLARDCGGVLAVLEKDMSVSCRVVVAVDAAACVPDAGTSSICMLLVDLNSTIQLELGSGGS